MYCSLAGPAVLRLVTNNSVLIQLRELGINVDLVSMKRTTYGGYSAYDIRQDEDTGLYTMGMRTAMLPASISTSTHRVGRSTNLASPPQK